MKIILSIFSATLLLISCGGNSKEANATAEKNYEKTKETLEQTEQKNPTKFLTVEGDKRKNLLGQTVVRVQIANKAKIVTYKDIEVKLTFYSKTGALLEEDHETIYENIAPGNSVKYKTKYFTPKGSDSVAFKVETAKF